MIATQGNFSGLQLMLTFSLIAEVESGVSFQDLAQAESKAKTKINTLIGNIDGKSPYIASKLQGWELVFGPVIYADMTSPDPTVSGLARNTTMIFYNRSQKQMVIAVAGTNSTDSYDWFTEDLEVSTLVPWNLAIVEKGAKNTGASTGGYISKGTATALKNTWNTPSHNDPQETPIRWLHNNMGSSDYPTQYLTVTGHSLGGAIAPTLAAALSDNPKAWNPNDAAVQINAYPFAGPTPGDQAFRNYVENKLPVVATINAKDVVPHVWQLSMMQELPYIFQPVLPPVRPTGDSDIIKWLLIYMIAKSEKAAWTGHNYEQWMNKVILNNSVLSPTGAVLSQDAQIAQTNFLAYCSPTAVENLKIITGVDSTDKLRPYLNYFFSYLILLAQQHTNAYQNQLINSNAYNTELATLFTLSGGQKIAAAARGILITAKLFKDLASFVSRVPSYTEFV